LLHCAQKHETHCVLAVGSTRLRNLELVD
jgi:hypothetical protein